MIRRLICRYWGHQQVPARSIGPMVLPEAGLVHGWQVCEPAESRGIGCPRCGHYDEHPWVAHERARLQREP